MSILWMYTSCSQFMMTALGLIWTMASVTSFVPKKMRSQGNSLSCQTREIGSFEVNFGSCL